MEDSMSSLNFIEHLHKHGKSRLFLAGVILFTIGNALSSIIYFGLAFFIPLILSALPIVGFWLVYAASKRPQKPEKTLAALTLFKIHTIINLVMLCLGIVFIVLISLAASFLSEPLGVDPAPAFPILFAVVSLMLLVIPLYYVPVLKILESIRQNIVNNTFNRIRGVAPFTVITFIACGLGILGIIVAFGSMGVALAFMDDGLAWILGEFPGADMASIVALAGVFMASFGLFLVVALAHMVGVIFCVITLNKFANSIYSY